MNQARIARKIIKENIYCTLATATKKGEPWISPVFFAYDRNHAIFWVSNKKAKHSRLLRSNPRAAIAIYNSQLPEGFGDGVYFETKVYELNDDSEIEHAMKVINKRITKEDFRIKALTDVKGKAAWRIYKAVSVRTYKLGEGTYINGQYVDTKEQIEL